LPPTRPAQQEEDAPFRVSCCRNQEEEYTRREAEERWPACAMRATPVWAACLPGSRRAIPVSRANLPDPWPILPGSNHTTPGSAPIIPGSAPTIPGLGPAIPGLGPTGPGWAPGIPAGWSTFPAGGKGPKVGSSGAQPGTVISEPGIMGAQPGPVAAELGIVGAQPGPVGPEPGGLEWPARASCADLVAPPLRNVDRNDPRLGYVSGSNRGADRGGRSPVPNENRLTPSMKGSREGSLFFCPIAWAPGFGREPQSRILRHSVTRAPPGARTTVASTVRRWPA